MAQTHRLGTRNTTVSTEDGWTRVVYHATTVVKFRHTSATTIEVILNSGGWMTATTKVRMNQAANQFGLGFSVYQKDFEWFVREGSQLLLFRDGMILTTVQELKQAAVCVD